MGWGVRCVWGCFSVLLQLRFSLSFSPFTLCPCTFPDPSHRTDGRHEIFVIYGVRFSYHGFIIYLAWLPFFFYISLSVACLLFLTRATHIPP